MITWLQRLIEKRGKWLFIVLLAVVIVSFVPYISPTGSSSLDFFSDDPYSRSDEYFNYDWNNPNDAMELNAAYKTASFFGTVTVPKQEIMDAADQGFHQSLFGVLQSAFQSRVDQEGVRELFSLWQAWPGYSREKKARVIAGTLQPTEEFRRGSIEAKIALSQIAAAWKLLPAPSDNEGIEKAFRAFLANRVDERVGITQGDELDSAKYEQLVRNLAASEKKKPDDIKKFLFEDFRADQVDAALKASGFALPLEGELDLRANDLLWKFEGVALDFESFEPEPLPFASIRLAALPEDNATLTLNYDNKIKTFTFRETLPEKPAEGDVAIGIGDSDEAKLQSTRDNLATAMKETGLSFVVTNAGGSEQEAPGLNLSLPSDGAPFEMPRVILGSAAFSTTNELREELTAYYDAHKQEDLFMDPARTKVTALEFGYQKYLKDPTPPAESELRQYFTLHPGEFSRPAEKVSEPPSESNSTEPAVIPDEDGQRGPRGVRGSVRKSRVPKKKKPEEKPLPDPTKKEEQPVKPDPVPQPTPEVAPPDPAQPIKPAIPSTLIPLADENATQAQDGNATSPDPQSKEQEPEKPITFEEARPEVLERFMQERRADLEREARVFAENRAGYLVGELHALSRSLAEQEEEALKNRYDPGVKALIDRYHPSNLPIDSFSEGEIDDKARAAGLPVDALRVMLNLPGHRFFSEETYPTDDGFVVMLLDARLPSAVKDFDQADFRVLFREFRKERKQEAFQSHGEEIAEAMRKGLQAQTPLAELAEKIDSRLSYHVFEGDDGETIRDSFDKRSKKLEREIQKAKTRLERFEATKDRNATSEDPPEIADARAEIKDKTEKIGEIDDEIALSLDLLEVASDPATKSNDLTGMVIGPSTKAGLFVRLEEVILEIEDEEASLVEKRVNGLETLRAQESRENLLSDWIARGRLPR